MRIAALYDVHGNVRALEAVLADAPLTVFAAAWSGTAATADALRRSAMPQANELAGDLLHPPPVERLLERLA